MKNCALWTESKMTPPARRTGTRRCIDSGPYTSLTPNEKRDALGRVDARHGGLHIAGMASGFPIQTKIRRGKPGGVCEFISHFH